MIHRINRLLMTLAVLLAVTTGAWAREPKVWTGEVKVYNLKKNDILAEGFSLTGDDEDRIYFEAKRYKRNGALQTEDDGPTIISIMSYGENISIMSYGENGAITDIVGYTYVPVDEDKLDGNAWVVTNVVDYGTYTQIWLSGTYYDPNGVAMTYNDNRTVWTIDKMPASDVELTVRYYDEAKVEGDAIAATDVHIGEDKALLSGLSTKEGTLVYAITKNDVTTAPDDNKFAADKNTAKDLTEAGTYRVWYYVDPDATHSPSVPDYKEVEVLPNKFDIALYAINGNTIDGTDASKATVKVGNVDAATDASGNISDVTMGQTVKITAKDGYKIKKVGAKKATDTRVFNCPVALSDLQIDDILIDCFSLKGLSVNDYINFCENRHKRNGVLGDGGEFLRAINIGYIDENCSIKIDDDITFTPYDGSQDGNAWQVTEFDTYDTQIYVGLSGITYTPLATINAAKTEATLTMPASDVELRYDLRRDLSTGTALTVSIGGQEATADSRLRIAKDGNGGYQPVDALTCSFADTKESVTISDAQDILDAGLKPQFYLKGDNDSWTLVTDIDAATHLPTNIAPGQTYQMTLAALDASIFTGETPRTVSITLYEGYEVTVPAQEYITYFKDEALTLGADETAAKLYTITAADGQTATATEVTVAKANMPILVKNTSTDKTKTTILLIPTTTTDVVNIYEGFKGTLAATTIAASDATTDRYAFNGKQFVWVKNALAVGANKAWLEVPVNTGSNARAITLVFGDATGIANTDRTDLTDGDYYDLNGRKLNGLPTKKGVYIQNGKKVVVK